jgi:hypothetical protein
VVSIPGIVKKNCLFSACLKKMEIFCDMFLKQKPGLGTLGIHVSSQSQECLIYITSNFDGRTE